MNAAEGHRIRWFVWGWTPDAGSRQMIPRTAKMRGLWGYDVECSCGWKSLTGGATRRYVEGRVFIHKVEEGVLR